MRLLLSHRTRLIGADGSRPGRRARTHDAKGEAPCWVGTLPREVPVIARTTQRDVMRNLYRRLGGDHDRVVAAYASAERLGEVRRASNVRHMEPEEYVGRLYADGVKIGWLP